MRKILVVSNSPTPYNDALFAELDRQPGHELKVIYCSWVESHRQWELDRAKGYDYDVAPGLSLGSTHFNPGVARHIRAFDPDIAVLTGSYAMPTFVLAVRALEKRGIPWVYWGEELSFAPRSRVAGAIRAQLRSVLSRAEMVLAIGSRAAISYARLGIAKERIVDFRYYADVEHFQLPADDAAEARAALRASWHVGSDVPVFLYCGQLIPRKSVDTLLAASASLAGAGDVLHVVLVGAGEQEPALRQMANALGIGAIVDFAGFVQPAKLPSYFAASDALVLPSFQEGWGLVLPEALAAGLPVIASDGVNSAADLVVDGQSGYRFPAGDATRLTLVMRALMSLRSRPDDVRRRAREAVKLETPPIAAKRMAALLGDVVAQRRAANG